MQERENNEVEISALSPLETIDKAVSTAQLADLAQKLGDRLRAAVDDLHRDKSRSQHAEAVPAIVNTKIHTFLFKDSPDLLSSNSAS